MSRVVLDFAIVTLFVAGFVLTLVATYWQREILRAPVRRQKRSIKRLEAIIVNGAVVVR